MNKKLKLSPQIIIDLKNALSLIFWKVEDLQDFLKIAITNTSIIGTLNWTGTKRQAVKELVDRMISRQDIYKDDLLNLIYYASDINDFTHLKYFDPDGSKTLRAKEAVDKLRKQSSGFFELTAEQELIKKRKLESEKRIQLNKSLSEELNGLKIKFDKLALNKNYQERGFAFEKFLFELFTLYELEPKGSFKIYGEQIDGAFTFQNTDFLLEAKWKNQVNRSDLATFCYKVETKFKTAVGLLISIDGVTKEAIAPEFKSIIIMDGFDLMTILEGRISLPDLLFKKRRRAIETGEIYMNLHKLI